MDPEVVAHDEIIRNKVGYLNIPFFFARAIIYISGWALYRNITRKLSLEQDNNNDISIHKKLFKFSAGFFGILFNIRIYDVMGLDNVNRSSLV